MPSATFEWFSLVDPQIVVSKDALQLVPKLYGIYEFEVFYALAPNHLSTLHPGALARRGISATYLIRLRRHSIWDANELRWYVDFAPIRECRLWPMMNTIITTIFNFFTWVCQVCEGEGELVTVTLCGSSRATETEVDPRCNLDITTTTNAMTTLQFTACWAFGVKCWHSSSSCP